MKRLSAALAVSATLALGSCAGTGITPAVIQNAVTQVQQAAVAACGFLPTAATVSGILATLVPGVATAEAAVVSAAQQICAAVAPLKQNLTQRSKHLGAVTPTVNGVAVHGRFVR